MTDEMKLRKRARKIRAMICLHDSSEAPLVKYGCPTVTPLHPTGLCVHPRSVH